ncbi:plant virulence effector HPE1-like domain-containing protein [Shinella sp. G-2]|uniref:plant virulence effector HPE1-like domain-containing protein n=1 Tax=Shinella sp. G-2 TaxID=3133141 RepID=UPI003D0433BC
MRTLLPTFALVLLAAPALAGSIEPIAGAVSADSIETVRCTDCPALKPKLKGATYHVDAITPGTQKVEVREQNGERKIFRTEAWMGGSPVLFVSKAPAVTVEAADGAQTVDAGARTSAVGEEAARQAATATMTASQEFDPGKFELRLK